MSLDRARITSAIDPFAERLLLRPWAAQEGSSRQRIQQALVYGAERMLGWSDPLTPPRKLRNSIGPYFDDPRYYRELGAAICGQLTDHLELDCNDDVLDVGCGCGQMAAPLIDYLRPDAHYAGFDVEEAPIRWLQKNFSRRHPNFHFHHADIFNHVYHPQGKFDPNSYRFTYHDGSFDYVIVKSVFTHLLPEAIDHYLAEISRVLRPGGRCWATFFVLTEESQRLIASGRSTLDLRHPLAHCQVLNLERPDDVVAIEEAHLHEIFQRHGLRLAMPMRLGAWCGRDKAPGYKDWILDGSWFDAPGVYGYQDWALLRKEAPGKASGL